MASSFRPVQTILKYEKELRAAMNTKVEENSAIDVARPRFVRVNNLKVKAIERLLQHLKSDGFTEITYDRESTDYTRFVEMASNLTAGQFMRDLHIGCVLVFAAKTHFYDHPLYLESCSNFIAFPVN